MLDLTVLGLSEDFVIRLPFDAPADLVVGDEVWIADDTVEPRLFEVAEISPDRESARFVLVRDSTDRADR